MKYRLALHAAAFGFGLFALTAPVRAAQPQPTFADEAQVVEFAMPETTAWNTEDSASKGGSCGT